ncbi:MAG: hypothetical protein ACK4F7_00985 [Inhella sp.]
MNPQRLLGLLGGMGWTSSLDLYRRINRGVAGRLGGLHSARRVPVCALPALAR